MVLDAGTAAIAVLLALVGFAVVLLVVVLVLRLLGVVLGDGGDEPPDDGDEDQPVDPDPGRQDELTPVNSERSENP